MQYYLMLTIQIMIMTLTSFIAIHVFLNLTPLRFEVLNLLGNDVTLVIDSLSAFFILIINLTVFTGALYAKGYLKPYQGQRTKIEMAWHYFNFMILYLSMLMVVMLREGISFLVFWELMSVSTFFLIVFESDKQENKTAGLKFLIQMHIALFFLIIGFVIAGVATGQNIGFESLSSYFNLYPVFPVFLLFFIGFGIKAGFIPLHTWLPHAHPAAPSHISGVMSGVMIKMGIYGILRVLIYIHTELMPIGLFILLISAFSGIVGVVLAIVQHDYKKLLAYHSIENIGIIGIGIGLGVIGLAINNPILASLGFAGGILHVLNHSLFKSLLFYSAGSIYQQTHTRNIEKLGGLMRKMPKTAIFFLIGAIAISGLPPFNGFISEFLIYSGLFKSLTTNNLLLDFILLGGVVSLVVIGGLAVYCFTKVFSIVFLGNARSEKTDTSHEISNDMLLPKFIIVFFILSIGLLPAIILNPLSQVTGIFVADTSVIKGIAGTMSGISIGLTIFITLIGGLWLLKRTISKKHIQSIEPTWGCGYTGANPATHQYTATSYAENIVKKASIIVGAKKHFTPIEKDDIFPIATNFETHNSDIFEDKLFLEPTNKLMRFMYRIAIFQTGNIQHYILYAILFIIAISILSIFNII